VKLTPPSKRLLGVRPGEGELPSIVLAEIARQSAADDRQRSLELRAGLSERSCRVPALVERRPAGLARSQEVPCRNRAKLSSLMSTCAAGVDESAENCPRGAAEDGG